MDIIKYIEIAFTDHKKICSTGAHTKLIDAYIEETSIDPLKWKNAVASVVELFIAISETTRYSMTWILFYLSISPKSHRKLQKELDRVVGSNGEIS